MVFHQNSSNAQFAQSLMLYIPSNLSVCRTGKIPLIGRTELLSHKGPKSKCSNYHPITLLSVPGKVFARVILARIQPLLDRTRRPQQSGFTRGRSTINAILALRLLSEIHRESNRPLNVTYLNIKAAGRISHVELVSRPRHCRHSITFSILHIFLFRQKFVFIKH